MPATLIDGKAIAATIREELGREVRALNEKGITPGLVAVLVGENPASVTYVRNKAKAAEEIGMHSEVVRLPATAAEGELLAEIDRLNQDPKIHGMIVQLPLPKQIREEAALFAVDPLKDVDGFHPLNLGRLLLGQPRYQPATPSGVHQMLLRSGHSPEGKHVVVLGRSNIVGKPMASILMQKRPGANATVTICHSGTPDLPSFTQRADILIAAIGQAQFVKASMVREGAVVIDVGINRIPDPAAKGGSRLVGDVAFEEVAAKAGAISPVPGGVGPMTIAMLMSNTVQAAKLLEAIR